MLSCMVTCRCTDKKPCDNNLIEPEITKLADSAISNILGGDSITGITKAVERQKNILDNIDRMAGITGPLVKAASAFMVEPTGLGKVLAPLSGN